ncbi:MAG: pseudouridine synthase [Bacteroidetes bacterium]|nr:pseudouridine synthase [Bacteroidota bacterium]
MSAKQKSDRLPGEKRPRIPGEAKLSEIKSSRPGKSVQSRQGNRKDSSRQYESGAPKAAGDYRQKKYRSTGDEPAAGKRGESHRTGRYAPKPGQPDEHRPESRGGRPATGYGRDRAARDNAAEDQKSYKRSAKPERADGPSYAQKRDNRYAGGERNARPKGRPAKNKPLTEGLERKDKQTIIRLNKYLADAGICSRREADKYIQAGVVKVNDKVVTELGSRVSIHDKVEFEGQVLRREKLRYVLLNKPKGYITTSDDPYERKTVMELVAGACEERIYPVGRLDRNTTGLLLLTNDGELAKALTHPSHGARKLYHVWLDKPLTRADLRKIAEGVELEDGKVEVDAVDYVAEDETHKQVGIELHSGRNRVVRRLFEHLGYEVVKLDRPMFAGLTKLKLSRGHWRFLTPAEISMLKRIR